MHVPNTEFQPMNALAPYVLAQYRTDLLAEAQLARRARLAAKGQASIPAWRRSLGGAFAYVARAVDPSRAEPQAPTAQRPALRRAA
jgi:hypothetical protein